ncbi:MAG: glycosyltransferase family 4 protein, partial [Anaerolineae bacterium]|nr:glycosyltransferase family 4 protein [Anaerolineae bacterium]
MRAFSLGRAMVDLGHDVTLMAGRSLPGLKKIESFKDGVKILQMSDVSPKIIRHGGLSLFDIVGRCRSILKSEFDIIHGFDHRLAVSIPSLMGKFRENIPFVSDWADLWGWEGIAAERNVIARWTLGLKDQYLERFVRKKADFITPISVNMANRTLDLGIPKCKIGIISVGANADVIRPHSKTNMREKYGFPQHAKILVYTGFTEFDTSLLSQTFIALSEIYPGVRLLITGRKSPRLSKSFARAGVSKYVVHMGNLPYEQLGEVMSCGDIMLLPYTDRPLNVARFPNRIGDYLAVGRPIATNPTGDMKSFIKQNPVGILADEDPVSFAFGIRSLLENVP